MANKPDLNLATRVATPKGRKKKDGKKKKKYSKDLKGIQKIENRVSKSGDTLAGAIDAGLETYRNERKKTAEKKKDGALVHFGDNLASGVEDFQKESAPALKQLVRSNKRGRKDLRKTAKAIISSIPFLR
jgi:hypothetical protein